MACVCCDSDLLSEASLWREHFDYLDSLELPKPAKSVDLDDEEQSARKKRKIVHAWPDTAIMEIISFLVIDDVHVVSKLNSKWHSLCKSQLNNRQTFSLCGYKGIRLQCFREWRNDSVILEAKFNDCIDVFTETLKNITELTICQCKGLRNTNVHMIGESLPYLQKLWILQRNLSDGGLTKLFNDCPLLQWLTLLDARTDGKCLSYLPPLTYLAHNLDIKHDLREDSAVSETLQELSLRIVGTSVSANLLTGFKQIKSIHIQFNSMNGYTFYNLISQITWIEHISIEDECFPIWRLRRFEYLPSIPNMNAVRLGCFELSLTNEALEYYLSKFPNIRYLHISLYHHGNGSSVNIVETIRNLWHLKRFTFDSRFKLGLKNLQSLMEAALFKAIKVYLSKECWKTKVEETVMNATRIGSQLDVKCDIEVWRRNWIQMSIICARNLSTCSLNDTRINIPKMSAFLYPKTSYYRQLLDE